MTIDDKISDLIRDVPAWQEGYAAGRRGHTGAANPYPLGSARALSWQAGMLKGRTKRLGVVKDA